MNGLLPQKASSGYTSAATQWVEMLRTLADPMRVRILHLLEEAAPPGLRVGELSETLKLPQSTISRHVKTLIDAHIAEVRRDGTSMFYRLSTATSHSALGQLRQLTREILGGDSQILADSRRLAEVLRHRDEHHNFFFSANAPEWDVIRRQCFGDRFHLEAMLALLNPQWTMGDLGTGTGTMLPLVAPHVRAVIAVDASSAMLKAAGARVKARNLTNVELRHGRLENLPIADGSLDVALVTLVLHHVADPILALREIYRVLKADGVLVLVDLLPHQVEMFREKMGHRWMGFAPEALTPLVEEAGLIKCSWHTLPAQKARTADFPVTIPDLFVMRAQRPLELVTAVGRTKSPGRDAVKF